MWVEMVLTNMDIQSQIEAAFAKAILAGGLSFTSQADAFSVGETRVRVVLWPKTAELVALEPVIDEGDEILAAERLFVCSLEHFNMIECLDGMKRAAKMFMERRA